MKYIRKLAALLIGIVFFAAIVIGMGVMFAVRNINVTLITYADDCSESYTEIKSSLEVFKGDSLVFLNESSISETLAGSNYSVVSCEKQFPCTINVTLKERLETFAVFVGGFYSMYDNDGKYLRSSVDNVNINDGSPNVELTGVPVENISEIAEIAAMFKGNFKALRSSVKTIKLDMNPDIEFKSDRLFFQLRSGLNILIEDYTKFTDKKIEKAYAEFCTLTDSQKLYGTIRSMNLTTDEAGVTANWGPNQFGVGN